MSAFEADRFNHSRTSPRRTKSFSIGRFFRPALAEKCLQQVGAAAGQHSSANIRLVVQLWMVQHLQYGMDRARFWIIRTVNQALNSSMDERASAHGARFNCSKQLAAAQAVIANRPGGFAQRHDLCVGGGI